MRIDWGLVAMVSLLGVIFGLIGYGIYLMLDAKTAEVNVDATYEDCVLHYWDRFEDKNTVISTGYSTYPVTVKGDDITREAMAEFVIAIEGCN